jgi:hypothetical protein
MAFPVEPRPPLRAVRFGAPDEAQDASYFAALARISSFCDNDSGIARSLFVLYAGLGRTVRGRRRQVFPTRHYPGACAAQNARCLNQREPLLRRAIEAVRCKGGSTGAYATGTRAEVLESDPDVKTAMRDP